MKTLKLEQKIAAELEGIRRLAVLLPPGKCRAILNRCDRIAILSRKGQAVIDAPVGCLFPRETHAGDIQTNEDIAARYIAKKAIFEAMTRGRKISLEDSREFKVSEMHTQIHCIRRDIERQDLPWVLCDEEVRPDPKRRGYKRYWLIPKEDTL